jgi:hypothetical protein
MATRGELVDRPRSGARPLFASEPAAAPSSTAPAPQVKRPRSSSSSASSPRRSSTRTRAPSSRRSSASTRAPSPPRRPSRSSASPAPTLPLPAAAAAAPSTSPAPSASSPRDYTVEGAGAILALFAYPLAVALLNGGPPLMWQWIRAKFTNNATPANPQGPTAQTGNVQQWAPTPSGKPPPNLANQLGLAAG